MAQLEATYENKEEGLRYGWQYPLPDRQALRIGRLPSESDWTMNDALISGYHASIEWDDERRELSVRERDQPRSPKNPVYFRGAAQKQFVVPLGESFVIGHTRFAVVKAPGIGGLTPAEGTLVQREQLLSRADLSSLPFHNPSAILRAVERVPEVLRVAADEPLLFRLMIKVLLDALPRADAVGVVFIPEDAPVGEPRVAVQDHQQRLSAGPAAFAPSRRLVEKAIRLQGKSCLHVWDAGTAVLVNEKLSRPPVVHEMTLAPAARAGGGTPWAVCTPFQDGSGLGLYAAGRMPVRSGKDRAAEQELTEYQKVTELIASLIESTRRAHKLERQNALTETAWPRQARQLLGNPERLQQLLEPRETEVTVLFCDLRNFSRFAEQGKTSLLEAWKQLSTALDEMSRTITDNEGVVAGFQGDAVMGFWGWPEFQERQVEMAARAALRIQDRFAGVLKEFKCGLGLAHGRAVAGRLGAHDLAKVDVYGPVVNLASRLEGLTKAFGVGIMVNEEVADRLRGFDPSGGRFRLRRLARLRPKGMADATLVSELLPPQRPGSAGMSPTLQRMWDQTLDWFFEGKWDEAYERLTQYFRDDGTGKCLTDYMERANRTPPAGWEGVITFTTKE